MSVSDFEEEIIKVSQYLIPEETLVSNYYLTESIVIKSWAVSPLSHYYFLNNQIGILISIPKPRDKDIFLDLNLNFCTILVLSFNLLSKLSFNKLPMLPRKLKPMIFLCLIKFL